MTDTESEFDTKIRRVLDQLVEAARTAKYTPRDIQLEIRTKIDHPDMLAYLLGITIVELAHRPITIEGFQ